MLRFLQRLPPVLVRMLMTRIAEDKAIPLGLFRPEAEMLVALAEIGRGGLKRFDAVDDLLKDLNADGRACRPVQARNDGPA